jgi:hypothetical protein
VLLLLLLVVAAVALYRAASARVAWLPLLLLLAAAEGFVRDPALTERLTEGLLLLLDPCSSLALLLCDRLRPGVLTASDSPPAAAAGGGVTSFSMRLAATCVPLSTPHTLQLAVNSDDVISSS